MSKRMHVMNVHPACGRLVLALAAASIAVSTWAQEGQTKLRTNPFVRPAVIDGAPQSTPASGPVHSNAPPSRLRFALAAGKDSLVNVDGRTLRIGDEINGYRLVAVRADMAIFSNGREMIELSVRQKELRKLR